MARIRTIKPDAGTNETLGKLRAVERWFFALLPCHADREGRTKDRPTELGFKIIPYEMGQEDPEAILSALAKAGLIIRYEVAGEKYLQISNFLEHQRPNAREPESAIPGPERACTDKNFLAPGEGKGREGKGSEGAPGAQSSTRLDSRLGLVEPVLSDDDQKRFDTYWQAVKKKHRRARAVEIWSNLPAATQDKAIEGLKRYNAYMSSKDKDLDDYLNGANFLDQKAYLDEYPQPSYSGWDNA